MKSSVSNMDGLCVSFWNSVKTTGKTEVLVGEPEVETCGTSKTSLAKWAEASFKSWLV